MKIHKGRNERRKRKIIVIIDWKLYGYQKKNERRKERNIYSKRNTGQVMKLKR